jgi:hypothetical protein
VATCTLRNESGRDEIYVNTGPPLSAGAERLFEGPYLDDLSRDYDVTLDGARFLRIKSTESTPGFGIHVALNWLEEHKPIAPASGGP